MAFNPAVFYRSIIAYAIIVFILCGCSDCRVPEESIHQVTSNHTAEVASSVFVGAISEMKKEGPSFAVTTTLCAKLIGTLVWRQTNGTVSRLDGLSLFVRLSTKDVAYAEGGKLIIAFENARDVRGVYKVYDGVIYLSDGQKVSETDGISILLGTGSK